MWVWRRRGSCIGCRGNPSRVPRFASLAAPLPVPLFPFPFSIFVCHPSPPVASHAQRLLQCGGVVGRRHLLVQRMCSCWWGWSLHHVVVGRAWWCFRGSCGCLVALCWLLLPWVVGAEPGKGSLWASVLSGRGDLQPEQKRLREAKKGSGDEQESRREREGGGVGDDESKCKHDRRGSTKHSFERAGLRVGLQPNAVPCPWHSAHSCPTWSRPLPTITRRKHLPTPSMSRSPRSLLWGQFGEEHG